MKVLSHWTILVFSLFYPIVAGAQDCRNQSKSKPPFKPKEDWGVSLAQLQIGMTLEECDRIVREKVKPEHRLGPDKGEILRHYTLDESWRLLVLNDVTQNKIVRFWISGLYDLKSEIDPDLFPLVRAIHHGPKVDGKKFDPIALVRSVNTLHKAGFKRCLLALREYDRLCKKKTGTPEKKYIDLDSQRVFLIGHLLFVRKDGIGQFPIPALAELPWLEFLDSPEYSKKLEFGDKDWPLFPLVLVNDFPLLIPGPPGGMAGQPTPPGELLDYIEKNCRLRERQLIPSATPWKALDEFLKRPQAAREPALQSTEITPLRLQVLRALFSAADFKRRTLIEEHLLPDYAGGVSLKNEDWITLSRWFGEHDIYWDANTESYLRGKNE